jgi:hypothetical protein
MKVVVECFYGETNKDKSNLGLMEHPMVVADRLVRTDGGMGAMYDVQTATPTASTLETVCMLGVDTITMAFFYLSSPLDARD